MLFRSMSAAYLAALAWLTLGSPPSQVSPVLLGLKYAGTGGLGGCASTLSVSPASGGLAQPFTFLYAATGGAVREVHLVQNWRVVAASTAANGTMTVYGQNLGEGTSMVKWRFGMSGTYRPIGSIDSVGLPSA